MFWFFHIFPFWHYNLHLSPLSFSVRLVWKHAGDVLIKKMNILYRFSKNIWSIHLVFDLLLMSTFDDANHQVIKNEFIKIFHCHELSNRCSWLFYDSNSCGIFHVIASYTQLWKMDDSIRCISDFGSKVCTRHLYLMVTLGM